MIDKKKLIEDIRKLDSYVVEFGEEKTLFDMVLLDDVKRIINKQPQADKWIPCEERLPSEVGMYLGTYVYDDAKIVDILFFGGKTFYYPDDMLGVSAKFIEVIAWQPLPQPYKKEGTTQ